MPKHMLLVYFKSEQLDWQKVHEMENMPKNNKGVFSKLDVALQYDVLADRTSMFKITVLFIKSIFTNWH